MTFELPGEVAEGLVYLLRHQTARWTWLWHMWTRFSNYGNVPTRAGTIYQYINISQYWQSQYNINTSYYSIDISKYWYIAIYWLIL